MGYTIELSVLHELSLRGEAVSGVPVLLAETPAGDPPGLVEPDSPLHRGAAHTLTGSSPSLPTTAS
jgi:hypothetical protein